ncbi:FecCD family ABC transporter permease [Halalkalibacterium ligniniphilum]|uniref:FecCD family ABC transporter permease n=1 Tax=Halalkalibacterium ligniniphilum TaxID=1134413 RepID=UPI000475A6F9|nr:iron ABC transporter permease [Halalkalibacterium ligniniphilum]
MLFKTTRVKIIGLFGSMTLCLFFIMISIIYGYTDTPWQMVIDSFLRFDGSNEHLIIQNTRVPRALIAAAVGASLGIAGVLMQALTNNPLADPKIFGINAGASFFIVVAVTVFSITSLSTFVWIAFAGAAFSAAIVYMIGSFGQEGLTPMKFTLAGAAIWALFSSLTQGLLVVNERALEEVLFWLAGSVQGRSIDYLYSVLPYLMIAWLSSLLISRHMNLLAIGEDVAKGLGQKTGLIKLAAACIIVLLAGASVAIAGPIGFIGIVVPHIVRAFVGIDYRWVIPYSAMFGAILLIFADVCARYIIMPQEVPVGVMTAIIGTPFFIYIARRGLVKR